MITNNNIMKKISLMVALMFVGTTLLAQKSSITDAALKFKKYNPMASMEENSKALLGAKTDIDLAAVNSETVNDPYMHRYRGMIYFSLMELATMQAAMSGAQPDKNTINEYDAKIKESFNFVLNAPKAKEDKKVISDFINSKSNFVFEKGLKMYNSKNYEQSTQLFMAAYKISKYINSENAEAKINTILSFRKAADTLMTINKYDEANKLGDMVLEFSPNNLEVIISLINVNLKKNDMSAAEKYLNIATSVDSTNKQLYYVLGTALIDMKQNEKAASALVRALSLDPLYPDAIYQYCSMLFNWSVELRGNASDLPINDPKIKVLEEQALNNLNTSIKYLEPYLIANPNDKTALEIGWRTYSYLDLSEKSAELKKRWEAIK
jgi:tetratricopeptide (TPR) repeat protein